MTAETLNQRALMCLEEQDFTGAQALFYENARRYPMHQTYHNLGCFLIDAGLTCQKGTVQQAHRLGLHYLQKAAVYRNSVQNLCAIIQHHVRGANEEIYSTVAPLLAKARRLGDCAALAYNDVALKLLCGRDTATDIACAREFVLKDTDRDTCMLLFYLLWRHANVGDMLAHIERYGVWIDADALLVYYAECGMYEEGFCLSRAVLDEWQPDAYIVSAAVECHRHVARPSVNMPEHIASCIQTLVPSVASQLHRLAEKTDAAAQERSRLLRSYPKRVPLRFPCLYFGCQEHGTPWDLT